MTSQSKLLYAGALVMSLMLAVVLGFTIDGLVGRFPVSVESWIRVILVALATAFLWFSFFQSRKPQKKEEPIQPLETTRGK